MYQRESKSVSWSPDLFETMQDVGGFEWNFEITEPSIFKASGHIDCHHRGVYGTENDAVMVAMRLLLNGAQIDGSVTGCNIVGTQQHYAILPVHANVELQPGEYTVELQARSASTAAHGKNGLAEIKGGYNEIVYEVISISVLNG